MNNLFIHAAIWIDIMPKKKKKMLLLKDYILYDFFYVTLLREKKTNYRQGNGSVVVKVTDDAREGRGCVCKKSSTREIFIVKKYSCILISGVIIQIYIWDKKTQH